MTASKGYAIVNGTGTAGQILQSGGAGAPSTWVAAPTGTIGGSVAATQVAFGSGTNAVNGSADLTFDSVGKVLALTGDAADCFTITNLDGQFIAVSPTSTAINVIDPLTPTNVAVIQPTDVAVGDGSQSGNVNAGAVSVTDNGTSRKLGLTIAAGNAVLRAENTGTSTPVDLDVQIAALKVNGTPGTAGQVLISQGTGAAPIWSNAPVGTITRVYTVGIDNPTIQDCINLCTSPSDTNAYVIRIPPGQYAENLTLKGSVQLQGMTNPGDTATVKITGNHAFNGTNVNPVVNRVTIANIIFANTSATAPTFDLTATVASQINLFGCFLQNVNTATTAQILKIGSLVTCYLTNVVSRMAPTAGQGGTHIVNNGGSLYCVGGVDVSGGTRVLDVTAASYSQITNSQLVCTSASGGEVIRVAYNGSISPSVSIGIVGLSNATVVNNAATGNGVNLAGTYAALYSAFTTFDVQNSATTYVITGVATTSFINTTNNYSNSAAAARNVKIKNTVTSYAYTTALTPTA